MEIATLGNGCHLFREKNAAGGYSYISDEIGGGVVVWDTALVDEETLLTAIAAEMKRIKVEWVEKQKTLKGMVEDNQQLGLYD